MIIISGKKYDRIIEAHIVTDEACYIIYDDENFERKNSILNLMKLRNGI